MITDFADMNMTDKENEMGLYQLTPPMNDFKNTAIADMMRGFGHLKPFAVHGSADLRKFALEFFKGLLEQTQYHKGCKLLDVHEEMFISVMVQKVYNKCFRQANMRHNMGLRQPSRRPSERSSRRHDEGPSGPVFEQISVLASNHNHERRDCKASQWSPAHPMSTRNDINFQNDMISATNTALNVAPVVPRMASSQHLLNTSGMLVEIWYQNGTRAHWVPPLSSCLTLHNLFKKLYDDLDIGTRRILYAQFKNQAMPSTRYDINTHNPNNDAEWYGMIRLACEQRELVDTTIVVVIEGQQPVEDVALDGCDPMGRTPPTIQFQSPDVFDDAMQDVSESTSSSW